MTDQATLTTLVYVAIGVVIGALLTWVALWFRRREDGILSDADRTAYATLHEASLAATPLRDGLSREGASTAVRHLRRILGTSAVSLADTVGPLTWDGEGDHHATELQRLLGPVLDSGRTIVVDHSGITCSDPSCDIRSVVAAPLVVGDRVIGALSALGPTPSAALATAVEEVAAWVSTQLELSQLAGERRRAVEAELLALRAQISPHFVYNSLGAIASFVRTDPDRARDLLLEFADFTRYALRRGDAYTPLADELRNVERYLVLEQARFGDRLQVSLRIAPEVLSVRVPFLSVQPLVENAVQHGLARKEGTTTITITAQDVGTHAEICVADDGAGADPVQIQRVLDGAQDGDNIGLGNVDLRLRQSYGDAYGVSVETAPGAGTSVTFWVPKYAPHTRASA